jgi:serine/threonine protein kinase
MKYLSSNNIFHNDLAARNILLCKGELGIMAKISDFGLSTSLLQNFSRNIIALQWTAPEILKGAMNSNHLLEFSSFSDVWSFGIVNWEIFNFSKQPYDSLNTLHQIYQYICIDKKRLDIDQCPIKSIIDLCWKENPFVRPTFDKIYDLLKILSQEENQLNVILLNKIIENPKNQKVKPTYHINLNSNNI